MQPRRFENARMWGSMVTVGALLLTTAFAFGEVRAANAFADPAFQAQWAAGETVTPNFWGPLNLAREGQAEPYVGGAYNGGSGQRLVQYFDKARMELTTPRSGTVTNGLLAVEMISGRVQLGDTSFEQRSPAAIPMAGDSNNVGPTYAMLKGLETGLLVAVPSTPQTPSTFGVTPDGMAIRFTAGANYPQANTGGYDQSTGHNIPAAFVAFRNAADLASIGLAISEPFWSNVKVGGQPKDVLIQAFERRVLTYTPTNPAPFQVEFGNIGTQYYTWRYNSAAALPLGPGSAPATAPAAIPTPAPLTTSTAATATTAMPTTTVSAASGQPPCATFASATFVDPPSTVRRNTPITLTAKILDASGAVCGDGTPVVIADTGVTSAFTGGGKAPNGASYVIVTVMRGVATVTVTINALNASPSGPVAIGVYAVRPVGDIQNGGFGAPVAPEYKPAIM